MQPIFAIKPGATGDITLKGEETKNDAIAWSMKRGGPYIPTPVLYRDQLYVLQNNGVVAAYDAKTGQRVYQERLGPNGGSFSASPVAADDKIYFTSEDGDVFVVKAGPKYELLATNPLGEVLMATPAISDGVLFFRGLKHVFAVGGSSAASRQEETEHGSDVARLQLPSVLASACAWRCVSACRSLQRESTGLP